MAWIDRRSGEVYTNIWFGSFYRPAYDDREFTKEMIHFLHTVGFNSVMLDTKNQQDFEDRFEGREASPYVAMTEYMQQCLREEGMSHEFLALYLNGDNLYPDIRFSPPIHGESVVNAEGKDGHWYRYWSPKAQAAELRHVQGMMQRYGENYCRIIEEGQDCAEENANSHENGKAGSSRQDRKPICSMWDPIVAPSFDEEGRERYLGWLRKRYHNDIASLARTYELETKEDFSRLTKEEYWFDCRYPGESCTRQDIEAHNARACTLFDNMLWKRQELASYFRNMQEGIHSIDPALLTVPDLTQWGYYLNIDGAMLTGVGMADLWDTAVRGIDLYELSPYVDVTHFISVPVTPLGDPDAYVVSASHSMMRSMNRGREFIGGIYFGRYLYNDLYSVLTPEEIIGSMAANGISGYTAYGLCGMDDGGMLQRMNQPFLDSLGKANRWLQETLPRLGRRLPSRIAILFPTNMASFETMQVEGNKERRLDLLGWYKLCCDLGYSADILDRNAIDQGVLDVPSDYRVLIVPADDAWSYDQDPMMAERIREFVAEGGTLLHGPEPGELAAVFGIREEPHGPAAIRRTAELQGTPGERGHAENSSEQRMRGSSGNGKGETPDSILVQGPVYAAFSGPALADYLVPPLADGDYETAENGSWHAAVIHGYGKGKVYSFGFLYGYSYAAKIAPHVPREMKNNALYPLPLSNADFVREALAEAGLVPAPNHGRGIETACFTQGEIVVNHASYPFVLENGTILAARTCRFLPEGSASSAD